MADDWSKDLEKIAGRTGDRLEELCKNVKIQLFSGVVIATRVDTGRMRGNWQITEDVPAEGVSDLLSPSGQEVLEAINKNSSAVGITYLTNNLSYVGIWEVRDAMVGKNVARLGQILATEARKIK